MTTCINVPPRRRNLMHDYYECEQANVVQRVIDEMGLTFKQRKPDVWVACVQGKHGFHDRMAVGVRGCSA